MLPPRTTGALVDIKSHLARWDLEGCRAMRRLPHSSPGDRLLVAASRASDHAVAWLAIAAAGSLCDARRRGAWARAGAAVAITEVLSTTIKRRVARPRPRLDGLPPLVGVTHPESFPSSHAATAATAAIVFRGLLPRWALLTAASTYALSRSYLGVHYPSDVLAGLALGGIVGTVDARLPCQRDREPGNRR